MITHPFVSGGGPKEEIWEITVNTEATEVGAKLTGVPISLYNQPDITVTVDWGDGTESVITSDSFSSGDYSSAIHEYDTPGIYTVQMKSTKWDRIYIDSLSNRNAVNTTNLRYFRNTLVATGIMPEVPGVSYKVSDTGIPYKYPYAFYSLFHNCNKLKSIPDDLFANNPSITHFGKCFSYCSSLTAIPESLFSSNTNAQHFSACFENCSSLVSIPELLFSNNILAAYFDECFSDCSSLKSIPEKLFSNNPNASDFHNCFHYCSSLVSIPDTLFSNNTVATNFNYCFAYCSSLVSIPDTLFSNNTVATNFNYCFAYCSSLTSIPATLFVNNTRATEFSNCFSHCSSLLSIPESLFSSVTNAQNFSCCFWQCSKIQSIPSGLFRNNSKVTNFHMTFYACNISDIPVELFTNCPAVTDLSGTFGSNPISSVPSGLFASQSLVTTLGNNMNTPNGIFTAGTAIGAMSVIDIDENLFAHMLNLTQARFAFQGRYGFSIRFRATELTDITSFCDKNTEQPVTVYVPAGSATAEAFRAIADTNGIIVVEE